MSPLTIAERESAAPVSMHTFGVHTDVVLVRGGGAGLPVALFSRWAGNEVVLLEEAVELGGTARKASFWYRVPNNEPLRALGVEGREEDFLCYVARGSVPGRHDAEDPRFGLTEWEYESFRAIDESASPATELLRERGADGVDINALHRVQRLNLASDGAVTGVEARTPSGEVVHVCARRAVTFATGDFTQDPELRRGFPGRPVLGGYAARTRIFGRLIPPPGAEDAHVMRGASLDELAVAIAERLERYTHETGGFRLADTFAAKVRDTIGRFNRFAESGVDEDFRSGERPAQRMLNGRVADQDQKPNPTMYPIAADGPFYAASVVGGTLDTKGGPHTDTEARRLNDVDDPIARRDGVGNCVASASGNSYWAGGATLGPMIAFAYRAAQAADAEQIRDLNEALALSSTAGARA